MYYIKYYGIEMNCIELSCTIEFNCDYIFLSSIIVPTTITVPSDGVARGPSLEPCPPAPTMITRAAKVAPTAIGSIVRQRRLQRN